MAHGIGSETGYSFEWVIRDSGLAAPVHNNQAA